MLRKEDHIKIGQLNKAHGVNGDFNVTFLSNYVPDEFLDVVLVEYDNYLVPFFVEDLSITRKDGGIIKFDHIHSVEETAGFVNCNLYAPNNHRVKIDPLPDASSLMHYTIKGNHGETLGVVIDYIDNPNNPLLEVKGSSNVFLMPMAEDFFEKVDTKKKVIVVNLPEGLIDLND